MIIKVLRNIEGPLGESIAGIDEAGRGPIIGPMVVAGVLIRQKFVNSLVELGVRDSKKLSPKKRNELYDKIMLLADRVVVVYLDPKTIDRWVLRRKLNELEAKAIAKVVEYLSDAKEIIIDTPSSPERFRENLSRYIGNIEGLILESKADEKYVIVGAASIIAKVLRDREINDIKRRLGIDFGSGYPSDPRTMSMLKSIMKKDPTVVRWSWRTLKKFVYGRIDDFI